jgi:hypothetical protein
MLLGTFSKGEIPATVVILEISTSIESIKICTYNTFNTKSSNSSLGNKNAKKICNYKKVLAPFSKKRKRIVKQAVFEIRALPKGEYRRQLDDDSNVIITKRVLIIKP